MRRAYVAALALERSHKPGSLPGLQGEGDAAANLERVVVRSPAGERGAYFFDVSGGR